MSANRLQLNPSKTEVPRCSSGQRQHQIPTTAVRICSTFVQPAATVRNLGVFIDADVNMKAHIATTVPSCFAAVRLVRSVRRCLPHQALLTLIRALVVSKVDRLLLFGADRCLQSSPWRAPVSSERCSSADFLGATVGPHHSASPRPALVAGPRADTVPTLCTGISLPARYSSDIPRRKPAANNRCRSSSSIAGCKYSRTCFNMRTF